MPIFLNHPPLIFPSPLTASATAGCRSPLCARTDSPLYHWIQTERSEGLLTLEGQELLLKPGDGVLIAPHAA